MRPRTSQKSKNYAPSRGQVVLSCFIWVCFVFNAARGFDKGPDARIHDRARNLESGTQRRQLTDSTFAYLRHANSCQKVVHKWCQIPNFGRCDQAAKDAKLSDTVASTTARLDRPPGCYMDTKTNTLFYNEKLNHDYQGSDRFGILCEQCPNPDKPAAATTTRASRTTPALRGGSSPKRCKDVVCGGKSHCIDQQDGFECFCAKGWIGGGLNKLCENVNECAAVNCGSAQSKCVDGINQFQCLCAAGFSGGGVNTVCTANVCRCANGVAGSGSSCPRNGAAKCVSCNRGFDLQMDDTCVDLCASQSCGDHGNCYAGRCYCTDGYTGTTCDNSPDPCATKHCGVHGRCFGGDCFCEDFYTGKDCQIPPGGGSVMVVHGRQ